MVGPPATEKDSNLDSSASVLIHDCAPPKKRCPLGLLVILSLSASPLRSGDPERPVVELAAAGASPVSLALGGSPVSFTEGGGFRIFDATAKASVTLSDGKISQTDEHTRYDAGSPEIRLHAEFVPCGDYLLVRGEIENLRGEERGYIVDYRLPRLSADARFGYGLEESAAMDQAEEKEADAFPIGAMTNAREGVAIAIPPTEPRSFGVTGGKDGLGIRFYLGVTPRAPQFANRASFVFLIYPVEAQWGFRSAVSRYYTFFPQYYTPRLKRDGLFMFQMGGRTPANVDQYGFDLVESQWDDETMKAAIARDQAHGITTFPYTIEGQRELKFLPKLPATYDEAMEVFNHWTLADHAGHALTKENVTNDGDRDAKDEILSSACTYADGQYATMIRETSWGAKSLTFKVNPNPHLFSDTPGKVTVGGRQLKVVDRWLVEHPEFGGIFVDSLGSNWPALFNFRADHFPYAKYPLTFDASGKVALHNTTSFYEFIDALRTSLRRSDRLVMANGVYTYISKGGEVSKRLESIKFDGKANEFIKGNTPPEHYRGSGTKLGRFFLTALLDAATCEQGIKATVDLSRDNRVMMGRKMYGYINYRWEDAAQVSEFVNKALAFGIYASSTTDFFSGTKYEDHANGYLRDKVLLDWYLPLVRKLSAAGWEPVRHATVEGNSLASERFGHGSDVYFTLYNDAAVAQTGSLSIDLRSLGISEDAATFEEIGHHTAIKATEPGKISFVMEPKRTYIISLKDKLPGDT